MCKDVPQTGAIDGQREARSYSLHAQAAREMTGKEIIADLTGQLAIAASEVIARGPLLTLRQLRNLRQSIDGAIDRYTLALERMPEEAQRDGYRAGFDDGRRDVLQREQAAKVDRRMTGPDRAEPSVDHDGSKFPQDPNVPRRTDTIR